MKSGETMPPTPIRFGTDGWRAVIGDEFTFANLERVAQAYAVYINSGSRTNDGNTGNIFRSSDKRPLIIVGYDRRFLSEQFARRTVEILAGNNIDFALFNEDMPTPLISWAVCKSGAAGGIVITASHNPAEFNGFKIKDAWGGSAFSDITQAVESFLDYTSPKFGSALGNNSAQILQNSVQSYVEQISSYIDLDRLCQTKTRVIIDSMHGTGARWVEGFLQSGSINAETIRAERDPLFGGINPEPIDQNLAALKKRVTETKAVLGLATDGDADRLGAVNECGQTMSMHEVAPILLLHLARQRGMTGGVVSTFSQSVLIKRIAAAHNLPLFETAIGFKYIADLMLKENILIGAEESGGIGVHGHIPERDGILNSLLLLEAVITSGKSPTKMVLDIHREFGEFYFGRRDLKMNVDSGVNLAAALALNPPATVGGERVTGTETKDGTKLLFADESWLLFRQSGTEPVMRIYAEATSKIKRDIILNAGESMARHNNNDLQIK